MFGFLNCNKPINFTSRDVVNVAQGQLRGQRVKVGHCGTLDPLADGVLVLGVGPAAKLVPFVHELPKTYHGVFRLGAESPTGDLEIEPEYFPDHPVPSEAELDDAMKSFLGEIRQTPPAYSAIKINGKRAYDLARKGRNVEVPERRVQIHRLVLKRYQYPEFEIEIDCSTGTYIRTLGLDIAKAVGTVAVMTSLTRLSVGPFVIEQARSIETLRDEPLQSLLLPASLGVSHLPSIRIDARQSERILNGLCLPLPNGLQHENSVAAIRGETELYAILTPKRGCLCPKRVFGHHL
ncbi:MAG: tRNA pseudouridine(55) synthase TruB [Planctomycetota bacterium]